MNITLPWRSLFPTYSKIAPKMLQIPHLNPNYLLFILFSFESCQQEIFIFAYFLQQSQPSKNLFLPLFSYLLCLTRNSPLFYSAIFCSLAKVSLLGISYSRLCHTIFCSCIILLLSR